MQRTSLSASTQQSTHGPHLTRSLRWFLLVWESLVYLWALLSLFGRNPFTLQPAPRSWPLMPCRPIAPILCPSGASSVPGASFDVVGIALFTVLMLAQGGLLWVSLSGKLPRSLTWFCLCLQGALVFAIGLLVQQDNVVLNLYLALILSAIALLRRARFVMLVAVGYVLLFLLSNQAWGTQIWNVNLLVDKTDYAALLLLVVGFILLYVQQVRAHTQLAQANERLQAQALRIEELTLVTERQRLARELHDTLAQGVAGLVMQLEAANAQLSQRHLQMVEDILHQAMGSARGTLADARNAIDDLRTCSSGEEFREAIDEEIRRFTTATGIPCMAELQALSQVPAMLYEHTFRMVREGLQNVARHAQARAARVHIVREEETLMIEVQDDGIGFESEGPMERSGHYGLIGLRERARLAGGILNVESRPRGGTTLRLLLPCKAEGDSSWALPSAS